MARSFAWSEDTTRIIGRTPTGRATVRTLEMNRESLINMCQVLHRDGKHPPSDEEQQGGLDELVAEAQRLEMY